MAITPATIFSTEMTTLRNNAGGKVSSLLPSLLNGKDRTQIANIALAAQTNGSVLGLLRLPVPFTLIGIKMLTDTSLGSSTVKLGNAANGNSAIYKAAATFTSTDTPTSVGLTATMGVPVYQGIDCVSGLPTIYSNGGSYGGGYEDIILTIGAADFPASGNLRFFFTYMVE